MKDSQQYTVAGTHVSPVRADSEGGMDPVRALLLSHKSLFEHDTTSNRSVQYGRSAGQTRVHADTRGNHSAWHWHTQLQNVDTHTRLFRNMDHSENHTGR